MTYDQRLHRASVLKAHAEGDMTTEDAIRALMALDPPAPEASPPEEEDRYLLDDHVLMQMSATPEVVETCLVTDHDMDPEDFTPEDLRRIGTAMYNDGEFWRAHDDALVRALKKVRPQTGDAETKMRRMVDFAWMAIARDLADETVPHDTRHFSQLHDYYDANQYLIDAAEEYGVDWGNVDDPNGLDPLNTLSNRLDAMLKARAGVDVRGPIYAKCPGCEKDIGPWEDAHWCVEGGGTPVHDAKECRTIVGCTCIHCPICPGTDVHFRECPKFPEQFPPEDYPEYYPQPQVPQFPTNQTKESN